MPEAPTTWLHHGQAAVGTLVYFPFRARGEPPHLVAAYKGLRLDNSALPFSEYGWMKRSSPNGLCPWIVLPDGDKLAETLDICLHLAKLPSPTGKELAPFDQEQQHLFELSNTPPLMHWPDNSNPENCAWLLNMFPWAAAKTRVPGYLARAKPVLTELAARLTAKPEGTKFFGGAAPGVGDIGLFATVDMIVTIAPDALASLAGLERLREWYDTMAAEAAIDGYLKARPQLGTRTQGNPGSLMCEGR